MPTFILGLVLVICAVVSVWDAARITSTLRTPGAFDLVGPDRYLLGVAILIGGLGAGLLLQSFGEMKKARAAAQSVAADARVDEGSNRHILLVGLVLIYAAIMPIAGYLAATFLFVLVTFKVMGVQDWRWISALAVGTTATFYLAFVKFADMSLPAGLWGIG